MSARDVDHDALIAMVRDAAFPLALRGYDRESVDAYVKRVNRLITDLEASRSPEAAIRRALDQVGEETSGILQRAQETASEITERSRASADDRIREAERHARAMTEDAEDRVRELEADIGEIWARRDRLLDEVRDLAERLLETADDAAERFPTQSEDDTTVETHPYTGSLPRLDPGRGTAGGSYDPASVAHLGVDAEDEAGGDLASDDSALHVIPPAAKPPPSGETAPGGAQPGPRVGPGPSDDAVSSGDELDFADALERDDDGDFEDRPASEAPEEPRGP